MGIEQLNQQQGAMAANLAAAENINQVLRQELERDVETDNSKKVEQSAIKKAISGNSGKLGLEIIANLAAKLATTIKLPDKILDNLKDEYDFVFDQKTENTTDLVNIKTAVGRSRKLNDNMSQGGQSDAEGDEQGQGRRGTDIKEYIGAYSQMLVNGGAETKRKLEQMESSLLDEKGFSPKELQNVKVQTANSVRSEILKQVKDALLKEVILDGDKRAIDGLVAKRETQNLIDYAFFNKRIGGYDFGGQDTHLQGAVNELKKETNEHLKEFLDDALSQEVVKKALSEGNQEVEKEIETLLKLGQKVGFDVQKFVDKIPQLKDNLGLNALVEIEYVAPGATSGDSGERQRRQYQYTLAEEKEVLTDKLRALFLKRAVHGDLRAVLETQYKMIKLKNGLIKLGVMNFDEVENEAKGLAKFKLLEMLREAFAERATYAKLSGPAWQMTERKIKTILRNLEKMGINLSLAEINQIRDKANERMFEEAEQELSLIETAIAARGEIKYLTSKRKLAKDILQRLSGESDLQTNGHELELSIKEAC